MSSDLGDPTSSSSFTARRLDPEALVHRLAAFGATVGIEAVGAGPDIVIVRVAAEQAIAMLTFLRDDESFLMRRLVDLTAFDRGAAREMSARFSVSYRLHSPTQQHRLRVDVETGDAEPTVDSVTRLWPAANWLEREVFDLFGIRFRGHPELRRILLDEEFVGAPLRKDYAREGVSRSWGLGTNERREVVAVSEGSDAQRTPKEMSARSELGTGEETV